MTDDHGPFRYIADLIEVPSPRDVLRTIAKDLDTIAKMAKAARSMLQSKTLTQPEAHGVFTQLSERLGYENYAFATLTSVLDRTDLPKPLANDARALLSLTEQVDADLKDTLLACYLSISKSKADVVDIRHRKQLTLSELCQSLQKASHDLANLFNAVTTIAELDPLPITKKQLEKARADIRHNRAETAIAATQLPANNSHTDPHIQTHLIAARVAINAITDALGALEVAYRDMEKRLDQNGDPPATVH
mgnify:CR=1 FL=1